MKTIFSFLLALATVKASIAQTTERPKLVIGIVVDQMRVDYLTRYESKFGEGGFKKLIKGGYFNKNANFNFDVLQVPVTSTEQNQKYLSDKIQFGHHTLKFN
jgi:hypothetical protein